MELNAEEFYNYISALAAEPDEIYVLGFTEVSEEEFNKALSEDIVDYSTSETKSKVVASRRVGKGKISLSIDYDVETENNRRYISSATANLEENIPDGYEGSANNLNCTISDNQKRAAAVATGDLYRIVPRIGKDIRIKYKVVLRGSVSA